MSRLPAIVSRPLVAVCVWAMSVASPLRAAEPNKYLPDGTFLVVTLNVKQLLDAPLVKGDEKAYKQALGEAAKVLEGFGVDPVKDVNRVVLAAGEQLQFKSAVLLLEGHFDTAKVQAKLEEMAKDPKNNLNAIKQDGATIFQVMIPQRALPAPNIPNRLYLSVVDTDYIAIAADQQALTEALAKKSGERQADVKKEVVDLVGKINSKETVSVVLVPPPDVLAGSPAASLLHITGGITVGDGIRTDLLLTTKNADGAKTVATLVEDGLDQFKQLVPMIAGLQPGFGPKEQAVVKELMDTIKVAAASNGVTVKSTITKEFLEKNGKKDR